ncbi:MAG: hypothetical protein AAB576_03440, partial [Elusimicrobiota bacterium]
MPGSNRKPDFRRLFFRHAPLLAAALCLSAGVLLLYRARGGEPTPEVPVPLFDSPPKGGRDPAGLAPDAGGDPRSRSSRMLVASREPDREPGAARERPSRPKTGPVGVAPETAAENERAPEREAALEEISSQRNPPGVRPAKKASGQDAPALPGGGPAAPASRDGAANAPGLPGAASAQGKESALRPVASRPRLPLRSGNLRGAANASARALKRGNPSAAETEAARLCRQEKGPCTLFWLADKERALRVARCPPDSRAVPVDLPTPGSHTCIKTGEENGEKPGIFRPSDDPWQPYSWMAPGACPGKITRSDI